MNHQLLVATVIEILFMAATFVALSRNSKVAHWGGTILLCLTFCWSVILGCVLALNNMTYSL